MSGFVAVHTGAGNCLDESRYERVIQDACIRGCEVLKLGGTALDACEAAIIRLENSGNTNAGFGSNLTWNGDVECEASIMDGSNLLFGACTNLQTVKNPISLARTICERQSRMLSLERIPPMFLSGEGATSYAKKMGCTILDKSELISAKAQRCFDHYKEKVSRLEDLNNTQIDPLETVGAVCIDENGNTAAGCSSGGLILKLSGRIGQAATYGAGCWAQNSPEKNLATCTTGNGEYLMKTLLAKEICTDLTNDETNCPTTVLHNILKDKFLNSKFLPKNRDLYAGALTLLYYPKSSSGEILWSHTTESICVGYQSTFQKSPKFVCSNLPKYCKSGQSVIVGGHHFNLPS